MPIVPSGETHAPRPKTAASLSIGQWTAPNTTPVAGWRRSAIAANVRAATAPLHIHPA